MKFLKFTSYLSVDIVTIILPIALAISTAFVYQRFNESNQLIALQSIGVSPIKMLIPLMRITAIVACYLYVSNTYISPYAWKEFRFLEFKIKNNVDLSRKSGSIISSVGFHVYAREYTDNFFFKNILIVDTRNPKKICSCSAKNGTIQDNTLVLMQGEQIKIDFNSRKNSVTKFQSYNYNLNEILKVEKKPAQPNEKYMSELLSNDTEQMALFHQKITSPLLAAIFSLLAFILVVMAPYSRKRSILRIILLIAFIIVFQGSYFCIANAAAKNLKFVKWNYMLTIIPVIVLTILIMKKQKL